MKSRAGAAGASSQVAQSIDAVRRRARHRLIGATVLVLLGVVGFSLLFDAQPRPTVSNIPIEIPDRDQAAASPASGADRPVAASGNAASLDEREEIVSEPAPKVQAHAQAQTEAAKASPEPASESVGESSSPSLAAPVTKSVATDVPKVAPKTPEGSASKTAPVPVNATPVAASPAAAAAPKTSATEGRFVVQVGAFADDSSVRSVRAKLERAGLKTYAQTVDTPEGKRTRVRLGPFNTQADADKAAAKAKALGLPTRILTL